MIHRLLLQAIIIAHATEEACIDFNPVLPRIRFGSTSQKERAMPERKLMSSKAEAAIQALSDVSLGGFILIFCGRSDRR